MNRRQASQADKTSARVELSARGTEDAWFAALPATKLRHAGDTVALADKLLFAVADPLSSLFLSASGAVAGVVEGLHEATASMQRTRWHLHLKHRPTARSVGRLRDGDVISLYVAGLPATPDQSATLKMRDAGYNVTHKT